MMPNKAFASGDFSISFVSPFWKYIPGHMYIYNNYIDNVDVYDDDHDVDDDDEGNCYDSYVDDDDDVGDNDMMMMRW